MDSHSRSRVGDNRPLPEADGCQDLLEPWFVAKGIEQSVTASEECSRVADLHSSLQPGERFISFAPLGVDLSVLVGGAVTVEFDQPVQMLLC